MFRLRSCASSMISVSYCASHGIALRLGEQDAVGHQLDVRRRRGAVVEADLVADDAAELARQLLRDTRRRRARGDPARLRVADQAGGAAPEFEADFRDLRRLARAGLAADDHHLMRGDQRGDLGTPLIDRQFRRELRLRQSRTSRRHRRLRAFAQLVVLRLQGCRAARQTGGAGRAPANANGAGRRRGSPQTRIFASMGQWKTGRTDESMQPDS